MSQKTQKLRKEALLRLIEATVPDNADELLDVDEIPPFASVECGPSGDWISLHENGQDAIAYYRQDDSDYVPKWLISLDTYERREIIAELNYRIADATGVSA